MEHNLPGKVRFSKTALTISFFLAYSFAVLFFCTKSSPFFHMNDWPDANAYFSMGKGMFNGLVPYRDIFDHKGPLLYFLNGLAYLISDNNFYGVYIMQSISLSVVLYFSYKAINLYATKKASLLAAVSIPVFMLNSPVYISGGGSPEEYILAFQAVSMYFFLRYFKKPALEGHEPRVMFIHGLMSGCVLMLKYTPLVFWVGFDFFIFAGLLVRGMYKNFLKNLLTLILGVAAALLPWLVYFRITDSIKDLYEVYFRFNSLYADLGISLPVLKGFIKALIKVNTNNAASFLLFLTGLVWFVFLKGRINAAGRLGLLSSFGITFAAVYFSGMSFSYYFLTVIVFIIPGLTAACMLIDKLEIKKLLLVCFVCMVLALTIQANGLYKYSRIYVRDQMAQQKFADIINREENPTLVNLITQDLGISTLCGTVPDVKYFYIPFVSYEKYPQAVDSQYGYIKNRKVKFVITRTPSVISVHGSSKGLEKRIMEELNRNYTLAASQDQYCIAGWFRYELYRLK
ncbi:MAG: glycosyltransferase family 39 protein [Clostridia bacterium]|nr:glycosyltransferase family 39 protein [Clostridia bacterium]